MNAQNESDIKRRHTGSHMMTFAIKMMFPEQNIQLGVGPWTETEFYQDFNFGDQKISERNFKEIEKKMRWIANKNFKIEKTLISTQDAQNIFKNDKYKQELIQEIKESGDEISMYQFKNEGGQVVYQDLCAGPHLESTGQIGTFKLTQIAGSYWRGNEKNPMLTRIYGVAFETEELLQQYEKMRKEAKARDHRKLGRELDLFHIDDTVGLGLPLWHPKGALLWRIIEEFWYRKHLENGYDLVRSPHIGNRALWEISGHWGFYNKSMYPPLEAGQTLEEKQEKKEIQTSEEYLLKPMNCPFHAQIYKNDIRSYRELPMRWAECGTVYRFEKKGELSGLTRVRGFTQDDAHIICRKSQVKDELKKVIDFILFIYESFGFDINSVQVFLSLRDPKNKGKYSGDDDGWNFTESVLRKVAQEKKLNFTEEEGEAAFYGPKLDFKLKDSLGRLWQCSTLQFDFNLPKRFELSYINKKGEHEEPYMLHRALFGSFERFIGLLIEHYAGHFPLWLAPTQIHILPITDTHNEYAKKLKEEIIASGGRAEIIFAEETLSKRIRNAQLQKINYAIIIGDEEIKTNVLTLREYRKEKDEKWEKEKVLEKIQAAKK